MCWHQERTLSRGTSQTTIHRTRRYVSYQLAVCLFVRFFLCISKKTHSIVLACVSPRQLSLTTIRNAFGGLLTPDNALPRLQRYAVPPIPVGDSRLSAPGVTVFKASPTVDTAFACPVCWTCFTIKASYEKHYRTQRNSALRDGHDDFIRVPPPTIVYHYAIEG